MSDVFIKILNMSLSASWLILAVMVLRLLLKKAPRQSMCLLWGLVALKLIIPFSPESVLSLIPSNEVIPDNITMESHPHINSGIVYIDTAVNPVMESNLSPQIGDSVNPMQVVAHIAGIIWCIGVICCLAYALISFIRLKMKVRASKKIGRNIYACDEVVSPFILGIFRPVIYIPSGMGRETTDYVIAHENAHLKRGDHFWKPLGFIILSVYWFNPLCWVAYILLCRDIEYACDEKVIRDKDNEYVNSYSQALLDCNAQRKIIAACPLAFGETDVKGRIRVILNYKKPAFWVIVISLIACIVCAICFMTKPKQEEPETVIADTAPIPVQDESTDDPMSVELDFMDVSDLPNSGTAYAIFTTTVTDIKCDPDFGYSVRFSDGNYIGEYQGLSIVYVTEGDVIHAGDRIGEYGDPGGIPIGLTMSLSDITASGCNVIFIQHGGNVRWQLETGVSFNIQVLRDDGKWEDISPVVGEKSVVWNDMSFKIHNDGETAFGVRWDDVYGELPDGHYRLHKEVADFGGPEGTDIYELYAEFILSKGEAIFPIIKGTVEESGMDDVDLALDDEGISFFCDFNGDGYLEVVYVYYGNILRMGDAVPGTIEMQDRNAIQLWYDTFGIPYAGNISYYLAKKDDVLYLVKYFPPSPRQGAWDYMLEIYAFDSDNDFVLVDKVKSDGSEEGADECLEKAESYLENSILLVSTINGELKTYKEV